MEKKVTAMEKVLKENFSGKNSKENITSMMDQFSKAN